MKTHHSLWQENKSKLAIWSYNPYWSPVEIVARKMAWMCVSHDDEENGYRLGLYNTRIALLDTIWNVVKDAGAVND